MLKNLFKPKWQHKDFAVRKIAVMRLSPNKSEDAAIIEQLAANDDNAEVRKAAIERLINLELLSELKQQSKEDELKKAQKKIKQLERALDNKSEELDLLKKAERFLAQKTKK